MKAEIVIDPALTQPEVIIRAAASTPELEALAEELRRRMTGACVTAFRGSQVFSVPCRTVIRFFAQGKGVACQTGEGIFTVRQRLYELEEQLPAARFVRVSHSEIVNLEHVTALDLSVSGTIRITLTGGVTAYASRRCVKKLKRAVGL